MKASSLWEEFKKFAFQGNMIDLAVAVVIGGAFGKIVTALVNDIIMPMVSYALGIMKIPPDYTTWHLGQFKVGDLMSEILNFLIVAACVFIVIVKLLGTIMKAAQHAPPPAPSEPTSKECPYCLSVIPIKATKCAHCTSELPAIA
ncbi:MAG: large conductance mechanosensitive channel protein MscL [Tepidisphaeraceae bacterium]